MFKVLIAYAVIAAAIATKNVAKMVEAVALIRTLVEKPEKKIISCVGAMDQSYGWNSNPFWDRISDGMKKAIAFFAEKHGAENVMFIAPVAQGFCMKWLEAANESGLDATVIVPSNNYIGKPFKEDGIFGTKAMDALFSKIGTLLITDDSPKNNLKSVKMTELLLIALSDEMIVFENSKTPKAWVENIVNVANATGVKVVKKDVSPFLNLIAPTPVTTAIPETPVVKLDIKKGFSLAVPPATVPGIIPAAELIKSFAEEIEKPQNPIVAITQNGITEVVAPETIEPPKKKRGRPRKKAVEDKTEKLQEQFMALPG